MRPWIMMQNRLCIVCCLTFVVFLIAGCALADPVHPAAPIDQFQGSQPLRQRSLRNARLTCNQTFEPVCSLYPYVRFWNNKFNAEDCYESPLRPGNKDTTRWSDRKYLVFEPDEGGWNNLRMGAETAIILAHATGRTLVLPPSFKIYLLNNNAKEEENISAYGMFFDFKKVSEALSIVSMEDFVDNVAKKGLLKVSFPAKLGNKRHDNLWAYLSSSCTHAPGPLTQPGKFMGLNITHTDDGRGRIGTVGGVKGSRYQEMTIHDTRKMVPYDQALHDELVLYVSGSGADRMLIHFYAYLYWTKLRTEQVYKRIVRDRLHYHDDIFCGAGRVVKLLHEDSARLPPLLPVQSAAAGHPLTLGGDSNRDATYFAFHIRRGDFQYKDTRLPAEQIWANTKHLLNSSVSTLIYIATDERNKSFFAPFMQAPFTVRFLDAYEHALMADDGAAVNMNHVGMIEQVICANAHTFIGTYYSTFTGYITRMRGYYRDGRYARTYYNMPQFMHNLQKQKLLVEPLWGREFERAHKSINH